MSVAEQEIFNGSKPPFVLDKNLSLTLINLTATNGNGHEKPVDVTNSAEEEYIPPFELQFTAEDRAEMLQGRILAQTIERNRHPYAHSEIGADQYGEGRRFDDISDWKRSDKEVKLYQEVLSALSEIELREELLKKLIKRWITPLNIPLLIHLIHYSEDDLKNLPAMPRKGSRIEDDTNVDASTKWYKQMLELFSHDDIIPVALMEKLLLMNPNQTSIHQLVEGFNLYFHRMHEKIRLSNDHMDYKIPKLADFEIELKAAQIELNSLLLKHANQN